MTGRRGAWGFGSHKVARAMGDLRESTRGRVYAARTLATRPVADGIERAAAGTAKPAEFMARRIVELREAGVPHDEVVSLVMGHRDDLLAFVERVYGESAGPRRPSGGAHLIAHRRAA